MLLGYLVAAVRFLLLITMIFSVIGVRAQHNNDLNFVNIPPNPIASKIAVFDKYEPILSSGMINVPIDIFNIKIGKYSLPLQLSYSTKGVSIEDSPLPYGYGWALNLNPRVNRRINGRRDEAFKFKGSYDPQDSDWGTRNGTTLSNYGDYYEPLKAIIDPSWGKQSYQMKDSDFYDSQKDVFSIQLPHKSIPFILIYKDGQYEARAYGSNVKIEMTMSDSVILGIKVTDEDGTIYLFGTESFQDHRYFVEGIRLDWTSWVLREIILPNKQKISFSWTEKNISSSKPSLSYPVTLTDNKSGDFGDGTLYSPVISDYGGIINLAQYSNNFALMLNAISFSGGSVKFNYKAGNNPYIDNIEITDNLNRVINKSTFTFGPEDASMGHLLLQSLKINDEVYSFGYNKNRFDKSSPKIDYWGFYNGKNNVNMVPKVQLNYFDLYSTNSNVSSPYNGPVGYADKTVDTAKMKAFMLERMNLPTGGYVLYDYEPHQFNYSNQPSSGLWGTQDVPNIGGGLRVKSIKFFNANGSVQLQKQYKYGKNENGLARIKRVPTLSDFIDENYVWTYVINSTNREVLSSRRVTVKSLADFSSYNFGNADFWYDQVTVYENGGKRNSHFDLLEDDYSNLMPTNLFNKEFTSAVTTLFQNGPHLVREEVFKANGNSYDTLSIKNYSNQYYYYPQDNPIKNMVVDRIVTTQ
jgi:hypothetical protein